MASKQPRAGWSYLIAPVAVVLLLCTGGFWIVHYVGTRAILGKQISIVRNLQNAAIIYKLDHQEFPENLQVSEVASATDNIYSRNEKLLSQSRLTYTRPPKEASPDFPMITAYSPWGRAIAHPDGSTTYETDGVSPFDPGYLWFLVTGEFAQ